MKKFTHRNDGFICENCGIINNPASKTCRNHCKECLYSLHVDCNPGDRLEQCHGFLKPINIEITRNDFDKIIFKCIKCDIIKRNKIADDDNREKIFQILEKLIK